MTSLHRPGFSKLAAFTACPLLLAGCAAGSKLAGEQQAAALPDKAEQVAIALAEADEAQAAGQRDRLAQAIRVVDASGARPLEDALGDPIPGWREAVDNPAPAMRGSPLGPGYRNGQIEAGKAAKIEHLFLSGERAKIALSAPGKAPLALRVRNAREEDVCERSGTPNRCQWVPVFTQRYTIVISNRGTEPARYYLVIE